jgi:hypothetical protein
MEETTQGNLFDLQVDHQASAYLGETARWSKFLSIVGFVCCGLYIITGIFKAASIQSTLEGFRGAANISNVWVGLFYIIFSILYFFPCLYLFHFSNKMKVALLNNDQIQLTEAFKNLKSSYRFLGILTIILLAVILIVVIVVVVAAVSTIRS